MFGGQVLGHGQGREVPVTLKMRMGWDDKSRNAPKLAKSPRIGIRAVMIHGRTRCQFYKGEADRISLER